jgi:hypothetical protein
MFLRREHFLKKITFYYITFMNNMEIAISFEVVKFRVTSIQSIG